MSNPVSRQDSKNDSGNCSPGAKTAAVPLFMQGSAIDLPFSGATRGCIYCQGPDVFANVELHVLRSALPGGLARICAVASLVGIVSMTAAQPPDPILVHCQSAGPVAPSELGALCDGTIAALRAGYPAREFQAGPKAGPQTTDGPAVTMRAFVASRSAIEMQLSWSLPGQTEGLGPRLGFSITDKDLTPDMQATFISSVVRDTPLPF